MGRKGLWRHILWAEFLVHLGAAAPEMDGCFPESVPGGSPGGVCGGCSDSRPTL